MNTFGKLFVFAFVIVLFVTACSPVAQGLQQLPDEGRNLVLILVTAGMTWTLLKLSEVFKIDPRGYTNAVAAGLAPVLITLIESWLQLIPPVFDNIVLTIIHLIVLLVGSIGAFFVFKRKAPSLR